MKQQIIDTIAGMIIIVGGIALAIGILYGTYYTANNQWITGALVATGHFSDIRATATAQAQIDFEAAVQAEVEKRLAK